MKEKILSFFKPRILTLSLAVIFLTWEYVYAFRGIDFAVISDIRLYFGFGLTAVNWDNFIVRTLSMGLIWVAAAVIIFILLWVTEIIVVGSHNRKITSKYVNRPKEDYAHLLKTQKTGFKEKMVSTAWLAAFLVLIPIGLFLMSGLVDLLRSELVFSYIIAIQDSGSEVDYYSTGLIVTSFVLTLPIWYLYSCTAVACLKYGRTEGEKAKIEADHFAVPVVDPEKFEDQEDEDQSDEKDSNLPSSPVI